MSGNKTIAKNTLFLYFRMILVMGVTLYTSRIVLRELGISDYGIYSLVGGFISLFGFMNAAMSSATQRYLSFDLGKNDLKKLRKTFSATLTIHIAIALLVLLLAETIGLWYVNHKMVFPPERTFAVHVVYQFSVATALIGIIQVPYNALIIARERMSIYAYVSIAEVFLKLAIVFLLVLFEADKLITYSFLTFIVALGVRLFYQFYCRRHYKESHFRFEWDKTYYKELVSYSGWNLFGNIAAVSRGQGNNVVLNLFFGTSVNAAYGIMITVRSAINSFIRNFQVASNPQIIKLYAGGEHKSMQNLINQTAKFSFYLSILMIVPFFLNTDFILDLWLINPPEYSGIMIQIALLCLLVDSISGPLMTGIQATGKIKIYQIVVGILVFLNLPISYLLLRFKIFYIPEIILYVWLAISIISLFFRLFFLKKTQNFNLSNFFKKVFLKISLISVASVIIGALLHTWVKVDSLFLLILQTFLYFVIVAIMIFIFGIEKSERLLVIELMKKNLNKI